MSQCTAHVSEDWGPGWQCQKNATKERLGQPVCGTHARQFDRLDSFGPRMREVCVRAVRAGVVADREIKP